MSKFIYLEENKVLIEPIKQVNSKILKNLGENEKSMAIVKYTGRNVDETLLNKCVIFIDGIIDRKQHDKVTILGETYIAMHINDIAAILG